jgi:hypothetical protein
MGAACSDPGVDPSSEIKVTGPDAAPAGHAAEQPPGVGAAAAGRGPSKNSNSVMNNASNMTNGIASGLTNRLKDKAASLETKAAAHIEKHTGKTAEEWKTKATDFVTDFRSDWKSAVCKQMDKALASTDYKQLNVLLDSAGPAYFLESNTVPDSMHKAAEKVAQRQLAEAITSEVDRQLKGALVAAERLKATDLPEFTQAVELYKKVRHLPEGWDVAKMVLQREGKFAVAKLPVSDPAVMAKFQRLLDATHRKVYTRDRMGQAVPEKLEVVRVTTVTNDELWGEYMARREVVRREIEADPADFQVYPVDTMVSTDVADMGPGESVESIVEALATDFGEPMRADCNEVFLFHGTSAIAASKITTENLRTNLAGSNAGTLYGRGVYLAENGSKSDEYTRPGKEGERHLLLCRAVLGRPLYSDAVATNPRECEDACVKGRFHSVLGDRKKARGTFREFVVFDKEQVYPNWIITYKRKDAAKADPSRTFQVVCPKGAQGTVLQVKSPDGKLLHALVPQGCKNGAKFTVQY